MNDDGTPLTKAEQRAAAQRERVESYGHPLFPTEPGEKPVPIAFIQLRRYTENGPVDHQRVWPASEIQGQDAIFQLFGGGVYEIWGRSALPNGLPGAVVKRIRLTLDGPVRPFVAPSALAVPGTSTAVQAQPADRFEMFLHMMREDRREARDRMERQEAEMRAAEERRIQRDEMRAQQATALVSTAIQAAVGIVGALLNRPPPPAPAPAPDLMPLLAALIPKPDTSDPLDKLTKVMEIADKVNPKKGSSESLSDMLAGFGHAMHGVAELEQTRIEAAEKGLVPQMAVPLPGTPTNTQPPSSAPPATANGGTHPPPAPAYEEGDDPGRLVS